MLFRELVVVIHFEFVLECLHQQIEVMETFLFGMSRVTSNTWQQKMKQKTKQIVVDAMQSSAHRVPSRPIICQFWNERKHIRTVSDYWEHKWPIYWDHLLIESISDELKHNQSYYLISLLLFIQNSKLQSNVTCLYHFVSICLLFFFFHVIAGVPVPWPFLSYDKTDNILISDKHLFVLYSQPPATHRLSTFFCINIFRLYRTLKDLLSRMCRYLSFNFKRFD